MAPEAPESAHDASGVAAPVDGTTKPPWPGEALPVDGTVKPAWPAAVHVVATIALHGLPAGHAAWVDATDPYIQGLLASRYLVPAPHAPEPTSPPG